MPQLALFHARRAIERANPKASARERDLIFLETHYGPELAAAVRDYLEQIGWDKQPPAPPLPAEIAERTGAKYREALRLLTGRDLPN